MGKDSQSTATTVDRALGLADLVPSTLLPEQLGQLPQGGVQAAQGQHQPTQSHANGVRKTGCFADL